MQQKLKAPSSSLVRMGMASTTAHKLLLYLFTVPKQQITVVTITSHEWRCESLLGALPICLLCSSELLTAKTLRSFLSHSLIFILTKSS